MSKSAYFRLSERLQRGIVSALRWTELRPVQELTIDAVLAGDNAAALGLVHQQAEAGRDLTRLLADLIAHVGATLP